MFGFLIGFLSLAGLIVVLKRGRHGRHGCGGGGCGGRGWHHGRHGHGRWGGWHGEHHGGPRGWLRFLSARLDATPGQEKEIAAAVEELFAKARELRGEAKASRDDVAKVLRNESLDETQLGELFSRHDDALRELQKAFAGALGRIHAALEPEQRARLAELIESGPRGGFGGPYRGWV